MIRVGVIGYGYWGPNIVRNSARARIHASGNGLRQESSGAGSRAEEPIRASRRFRIRPKFCDHPTLMPSR